MIFVCYYFAMTTKELENYIRSELEKGTTFQTIKNNLLVGGGWQPQEIDAAYQALIQDTTTLVQSKKKTWIGTVALVLLIVLGGGAAYAYYAGYFTSLEQVTAQSFVEARNAKSAAFDTTISVDFSSIKKVESKTIFGDMFSGLTSFTTKGAYDLTDPENTKLSMAISLVLGSTSAAADFRLVHGVAYAQLTKAPTISLIPVLSKSEKKWVSFPYKSQTPNIMSMPFTSSLGVNPVILEKLTDEQKQELYQITANAHFITITKKFIPETIDNTSAYHFTFDIDRDGIKQYFKEVQTYIRSIGKEDSLLSTFDTTSYIEGLEKVTDFAGEMWIGKKDSLPRKVTIGFTVTQKEGPIKVAMVSILSDWNKPVDVQAPEKSVTFEQFISGMFSNSFDKMSMNESASVTQAGKDAQIKARLANLRVSAEIYWDGNPSGGYTGACNSSDFNTAKSLTLGFICRDSKNTYAASAQLSNGKYFCIDSTGTAKEIAQAVATTSCL